MDKIDGYGVWDWDWDAGNVRWTACCLACISAATQIKPSLKEEFV